MPRSKEGLARLVLREGVSPRVAAAFRGVDRAQFVPVGFRSDAYADRPIAIPERQTTSQPSLIARMVDEMCVADGDRVLEIGTGFGFQTAVLARLATEVVSIDRYETLTRAARENLDRAAVSNATLITGDGRLGAPAHAPFQAVVVSAAAQNVPPALVDQLGEGGRLVIPLRAGGGDEVVLFVKRSGALVRERLVTPARFVPLVPGSQAASAPGAPSAPTAGPPREP